MPTEAICLGPVTRRDADALIRANLESRALHHPWAHPPTDRAGFETWYERILLGPLIGLVGREATSGEIVGVVTLSGIAGGGFQNACLGYYDMIGTARRGLMTASVAQACRYGFDGLGLHRLEANIQPGNAASIALARRIGFRLEGFSPRYLRIDGAWRDHQRWALLADEIKAG